MDDSEYSRMPTTDSPILSKTSAILNGIMSHLQDQVMNNDNLYNSKTQTPVYDDVFPSNHPFLFPKSQNTPLTARESDLITVANDYAPNGGLLGSRGADTSSLAWIIPTIIGIVAAMVIVGLLCFFGVRALELKCLRWCHANCQGCCGDVGEERDVLTTTVAINQTEMTNYKSASNPDEGLW